jgi:hypothetical protein
MAEQTDRFDLTAALALATVAHAGQDEKGLGTPYLGHLLRVASTVIRAGGSPDQARAALLHDAVEDGGRTWWPDGEPVPAEAWLVLAADKLDAIDRSHTALDRSGDAFWGQGLFKGGRLGSVWYWRAMVEAIAPHLDEPLATELVERVRSLARRASRGDEHLDEIDLDELLEAARNTPYPDGIREDQR